MRVNVNGINLNYESAGSGRPIVFVHGLGADLSLWNNQASALEKEMKIVRHDVRGFGNSDKITSPPPSIELWAADLYGLIKALRFDKVIVAGHSMSGMTVLRFALNHPELTEAIVVIDGTSEFSPEAKKILTDRAATVRKDGMVAVVDRVINAAFYSDFLAKNKDTIIARYRETMVRNDVASYAAACEAITKCNLTEELGKLQVPTLILVGEADVVTPVAAAEKLNKAISNSLMKIIPNAGHITPLEQPAILTNTVRRFIKIAK